MNKHIINGQQKKGLLEGPFLFLVNPRSGTGAVNRFHKALASVASKRPFEVIETTSREHGEKCLQRAVEDAYAAVIAVGGDGTVHETAKELIGTPTALGIIPTGSGNGISRHLGISNQIEKAVEQMLAGKYRSIDTLKMNGKKVIGFCGVGIDAEVAKRFNHAKERGFGNYIKLTMAVFQDYQPHLYRWETDEESFNAFTVLAANTNQLGNNAYINPKAIDDDGAFELIVIKAFPPASLMPLASRLFLKNLDKSKFVEVKKVRRATLINPSAAPIQIDGDLVDSCEKITFEVNPLSLNVIVP